MQYPLQGLSLLIGHTLHPDNLQQQCRRNNSKQELTEQVVTVTGQARMAICRYMATPKNTQQAIFMLHGMRMALHEVLNAVYSYEQKVAGLNWEHPELELVNNIYGLTKDQVETLLLFLRHNFENLQSINLPSFLHQDKNKLAGKEQQLVTNLSVPQLALFLRLIVDAGIIAGNNNITSLTAKVAAIVHTKKTAEVSPESLRIKYYAPEKAAISILKDYLLRMLGLLKNY